MSDPTVPLDVTQSQRRTILSAMHDKKLETERYLSSYGRPEQPGPLDTCCEGNFHRYEERQAQRSGFVAQLEREQAIIELVQQAEWQVFDSPIAREIAGALHDREDNASVHAAEWLADNENDDVLCQLIGGALDEITKMAAGASATSPSPRTGHSS